MSLDINDPNNKAKIEVRGYPIGGKPWSHIFIVYTVYNSSGDKIEYYFRGGPSAAGPGASGLAPQITGGASGDMIGNPISSSGSSPWGKVNGWQGIYEEGTPDFGEPNTTSITIIDSTQTKLQPVFIDISDKLNDIVSELHDYNPINSNSNTTVFTILNRVSADFPSLNIIPKLPFGIDGKEIWAPGATTNFTTPLQDMEEWGTVKFKNLVSEVFGAVNAFGNTYQEFKNNLINKFENAILYSNGLSDTLSAAYWKFLDSIAKSLIDPLIIDLSNNGIALDSWQASNALFDLNGNGTKENTGWTKANGDDAFLVIDKNSNGKIDDITEMFGNASIPGFTELAKYDSNKDNLINSLDSQFSLLRLWNDKNANGTVDAGEMTTIAANDNCMALFRSAA